MHFSSPSAIVSLVVTVEPRAVASSPRDNTEDERFSPGERYGAVYQINYLR